MNQLCDSTFRIGIKYNPILPIQKMNIAYIPGTLHSLEGIEIDESVKDLFITFRINKYPCDIKIRNDGSIVIYSTQRIPSEYIQMKNYCINLVIISKEVLEYLRIHNILDYDLRCDSQFICHGLDGNDKEMDYFINSILKIFNHEGIEDLYIRNGSAVISGLYPLHIKL
jgi:hypothetical protein